MCSISAISNVNSPTFKQLPMRNSSKQFQKETERMTFNSSMIGLSAIGVASIAFIALSNKNVSKTAKKEVATFVDFMKEAKRLRLDEPQNIKNQIVEKNIIGTGANSVVYKFSEPSMDRWAIKLDSKHVKEESFNNPIEKVEDVFGGLNMGQEIARIGENVHILKRIHGEPHSIPNWSAHRTDQTPITKKDADTFIN
ncbi:MAG: hypothetical protein NC200_01125, partial [Candidatus Gastranaerophilales bacterium]|nr:hypothetical protein [Candidatus Gastranaerophilales bacterium]